MSKLSKSQPGINGLELTLRQGKVRAYLGECTRLPCKQCEPTCSNCESCGGANPGKGDNDNPDCSPSACITQCDIKKAAEDAGNNCCAGSWCPTCSLPNFPCETLDVRAGWCEAGTTCPGGTDPNAKCTKQAHYIDDCNPGFVESSAALTLDKWIHVTISFVASKLSLYIDGTLSDQKPMTIIPEDSATPFLLFNRAPILDGTTVTEANRRFIGTLKDVRFYKDESTLISSSIAPLSKNFYRGPTSTSTACTEEGRNRNCPYNMLDGRSDTFWHCDALGFDESNVCWAVFEFKEPVELDKITIKTNTSLPDGFFRCNLEQFVGGAWIDRGEYETGQGKSVFFGIDIDISSQPSQPWPASSKWKLSSIKVFRKPYTAGYPSISQVLFHKKSYPWFLVDLPYTIENPRVALSTTFGNDMDLEMWIASSEGENTVSGRTPWKKPTDAVKCGILSKFNSEIKAKSIGQRVSHCQGSGKFFFILTKDGASLPIVVKELEIMVLRTSTLGVWCVPFADPFGLSSAVTWFVSSSGNVNDAANNDVRDWTVSGSSLTQSFGTIQHALSLAEDGDTIRLSEGTFGATSSMRSGLRCTMNMLRDFGAEYTAEDTDWGTTEGGSPICSRETDGGAKHVRIFLSVLCWLID